jgi:hypothetical protein
VCVCACAPVAERTSHVDVEQCRARAWVGGAKWSSVYACKRAWVALGMCVASALYLKNVERCVGQTQNVQNHGFDAGRHRVVIHLLEVAVSSLKQAVEMERLLSLIAYLIPRTGKSREPGGVGDAS